MGGGGFKYTLLGKNPSCVYKIQVMFEKTQFLSKKNQHMLENYQIISYLNILFFSQELFPFFIISKSF